MLFQLHHERPDGTTDCRAQTELDEHLAPRELAKQLHEWYEGVKTRHPLPEGCNWLISWTRFSQCEHGGDHFLYAACSPEVAEERPVPLR